MSKTKGMTPFGQHGERSLWCAVLHNAVAEAQGSVIAAPNAVTAQTISDKAFRWLTTPNADFDAVCYLAGFDPDAVRERMQALLAAGGGSKLPHVLGTGARGIARDSSQMGFSE